MQILKPLLTASALLITSPLSALADSVLLSVSGAIAVEADAETWEFDADDLRALPSSSFKTETIWTEGVQTFEGVSLADLLDHVDAAQGTLIATAANDYAVSIPTSDAVPNGPIIAYLRNGKEMSLRDKGPLWIVYPYDDTATYNTEEYFARSIWQLDRLEVVAED